MSESPKVEIDSQQAVAEIEATQSLEELEKIRLRWLGRKGQVSLALKSLGRLAPEQRAQQGARYNEIKQTLQAKLDVRHAQLIDKKLDLQVQQEGVDLGLPGRMQFQGSCHPVSDVTERIVRYFISQSFQVVTGPEVEDDDHNFRLLNFPENHPARTMHDSFYLPGALLLRTHTSSVQIRYLQDNAPPTRIIAPGRVYRRDHDLTHSPMFTQVEGLVIDRSVSIAELLGTLNQFVLQIFARQDLKTRYRPSFFPFTEPSYELDISCLACSGQGCRVCGHSGWLEVLGCGMVHPNVLRGVNIDPNMYSGYAFGLGVERLAMLLHGIGDLRLLFENHLDFLKQFQPTPC